MRVILNFAWDPGVIDWGRNGPLVLWPTGVMATIVWFPAHDCHSRVRVRRTYDDSIIDLLDVDFYDGINRAFSHRLEMVSS